MHQGNIRLIANLIEDPNFEFPHRGLVFNQCNWGDTYYHAPENGCFPCETRACIAGHTVAYFEPETFTRFIHRQETRAKQISDLAASYLWLSKREQDELFCTVPEDETSRTLAAAVLRHFADTGEINWDIEPSEINRDIEPNNSKEQQFIETPAEELVFA